MAGGSGEDVDCITTLSRRLIGVLTQPPTFASVPPLFFSTSSPPSAILRTYGFSLFSLSSFPPNLTGGQVIPGSFGFLGFLGWLLRLVFWGFGWGGSWGFFVCFGFFFFFIFFFFFFFFFFVVL